MVLAFFKGMKKGFESFSKDISGFVNAVILTIVYVLGVGLTAIIAKVSGKKFLDLTNDKGKKSYYTKFEGSKEDLGKHLRQF